MTITDLFRPITSLGDNTRASGPVDYHPAGNKSYVCGDTCPPLWHKTVPELLEETVDRFGPRCAVVFPQHEVRWSYYDLAREVETLAAGLLAIGLNKGDSIAIWSPNRPEWIVTQYATARLGLVLVTINPAYRLSELEYALNTVECKAIVTAPSFKSSNYLSMLKSLAPELEQCKPGRLDAARLPSLKCVITLGQEPVPGMFSYRQVTGYGGPAQLRRLPAIAEDLDPDEPINIQFTSGTTGSPKGATLTHKNIINNGRFVAETMGFSETDRLCLPVPLYHCFGMVLGSLGCMTSGAAMVFPGESFDPETTLSTILGEQCTALYGVPTMFVSILEHEHFLETPVTTLRTGIMAGAPCPVEVMKRVVEEMGMDEVTIAYGMTETSPVSFQTHVDDPMERKVSTVGRIHPHTQAKIIDECGRTVRTGQTGELCTKGYSVMQGYWNDDAHTRECIDRAGWMHSGDLATIDEEGYCRIVGRLKDMLIRGGENIYPREIEEFLFSHPHIQEAQVFGVPDEKYGEEVCAWIVLKKSVDMTEDQVREFCRDRIAHYKIPRYIRFKPELPMTVTGKPQKYIMRDAMIEELGADPSGN